MTEKQWYRFLLEELITMETIDGTSQLKKCRVERMHQLYDWETTWRRSRLPGLGPNLTSFIFKVAHDLLPTKERLSKVD